MDTLTRVEDEATSADRARRAAPITTPKTESRGTPIEQTVLVFQGGGALGACQAGVYQALTEAGIEPDWVIGTSIGAINGTLIVGNKPGQRLARLQEFWGRLGHRDLFDQIWSHAFFNGAFANIATMMQGVAGFFQVN